MDNVNDIFAMLKDRLVNATLKTNRIKVDIYVNYTPHYTFAELFEAQELEDQLRSILCAITGKDLFWSEYKQAFFEQKD